MKQQNCHYCNEKITAGRKCINTNIVLCHKNNCINEYALNNTNLWGYN